MAKRETKETYKESREAAQGVSGQYDPLLQQSQERASALDPSIAAGREELAGGYRGMMADPTDIAAPSYTAREWEAKTIDKPGQVNVDELKNALQGYKDYKSLGGLTPENIERMRGMGGFEEFAKTGGYTPESLANIKAQAISPIGAYATGTREELDRRRALQGGYAPGFDAASRALQRDTARGIADTSLAANIALQDRINAGRQWGIGGLTQAEQGLTAQQAAIDQMKNQAELARLAGQGGISGQLSQFSAADIDNLMRQGMFNASAMNQAAAANAAAANQAAAFNAQGGYMADVYNQQNQQGQYAAGLGGLGGLYGGDVGLQQSEYDRQLQIQNAENAARGGYLGTQSGLATQPGWGGNLMGAIGAGAGIAAGMWNPRAAPGMGQVYTPPNVLAQQYPQAPW